MEREPPVRAWLPIVSQLGDLRRGSALALRVRLTVWRPEVLARPRSRQPKFWYP